MKIQYASDLHLELGENTTWLKNNPLSPVGDVLILAGDIAFLGDQNYSAHPFWNWVSKAFKQVIIIPGNHELYKYYDINKLYDGWELEVRDNVKVVYNKVIHLTEDIDIIASTLWGKISPAESYITEYYISDFHRIRNGRYRLSSERFNQENERCREFIEKSVNESKAKHIIVVTHHVPSYALSSDEFKNSQTNGAFNVEMGNFIADSRIDYWIFGHSHRNINKTIGQTQCISNQLGYVSYGENKTFRRDACIEL